MQDSALFQTAAAVVHNSEVGAVMVALILVIQWLFRKRLSAGGRSALWLLLLVRLALPVSPPSAVSVFNLAHVNWRSRDPVSRREPAPVSLTAQPRPVEPAVGSAFATTDALPALRVAVHQPDYRQQAIPMEVPHTANPLALAQRALPWVWLVGMLLFAIRLVWQNIRFAALLRRAPLASDPALEQLLENCAREMGLRRPPRLCETTAVQSPGLYGLFRPRLLLPAGLSSTFSRAELRFIFLHELAHVRRQDLAVNWLISVLQAVHWFNPVLWLAFARMRTDRELACDALALSRAGEGENQAYGNTILKILSALARPAATPGLVGIGEDMRQMANRMRLIARFKRSPSRPLAMVLLFGALALATLTDAQPGDSPESIPLDQGLKSTATVQPKADATTNASTATVAGSTLIEDARLLIEMGRLDEAEAKLRQLLRQNPDDGNAFYYLSLINEARFAQESRKRATAAKEPQQRGLRRTPGRQKIYEKLKSILLERVTYDGWTLREVVQDLKEQARASDPERRGINFIVNPNVEVPQQTNTTSEINETAGKPPPASPPASVENLNDDVIVHLALRHVRLGEVVDAIAKVASSRAGTHIKYSVEDYAVVFTQKLAAGQGEQLFTRTYRVDPKTFLTGLRRIVGQSTPPIAAKPSPTVSEENVGALLHGFLTAVGVELSNELVGVGPGQLARPAVFYNDVTGLLLVRATMEDLDTVEKAIQVLNVAPPLISIEARLLELNAVELGSLRQDATSWNALTNKVPVLGDIPLIGRLFRSESDLNRTNTFPQSGGALTEAQSRELVQSQLRQKARSGILTRKQLDIMLRALESGQAARVLAAPRVTTISGQQIRTQLPALGFSLEVLPGAMPDGNSVRLEVDFTLSADGQAHSSSAPVHEEAPLRVSTSGIVWDGQTMVLGPLPSDGRDSDRCLLLLITPNLVDPAGNPVNGG